MLPQLAFPVKPVSFVILHLLLIILMSLIITIWWAGFLWEAGKFIIYPRVILEALKMLCFSF